MIKYLWISVFFLLMSCRETNSNSNDNKSDIQNLNSENEKLKELAVTGDFQFAIGGADKILDAVKKQDYDYLNRIETEGNVADFSLHINLKDIDMLLYSVSVLKNEKNIEFQKSFNFKQSYVNESEYGAIQLTPEFITFFSSIDEFDAEQISKNWFIEMAKAYPSEEIKATTDAKEAIHKLIHISKHAKLYKSDMVFLWTS